MELRAFKNSLFTNSFWVLAFVVAVIGLNACGTGEIEKRMVDLKIRDGSLVGEGTISSVKQGDIVTIVVSVDEPASFHLHGYDIEERATPEKPARIEFSADATGSFPLTIHMGADDIHVGDHHNGIEGTTTVVVKGEHVGEEGEGVNQGHNEENSEGEEIDLGRLEVYPR